MDSTRRVATLLIPVALLVGLSGCALIEPANNDDPPTALESCAMGTTWTLDMADLGTQVTTALTNEGVVAPVATADGTRVFTWNTDGSLTIDSDYTLTITSTATDQVTKVVETHRGTSTGKAFINGDVAIPRDWDGSGLSVDAVADLNEAPLETVPFLIPETDIDDSVGLELTCDGDTLTIHPRGGPITQTWSRSEPAG